jgi:starch synthase
VLFAAAECAPLVKAGGLGDVAGALPAALRRQGLDVRVLLPGYPAVLAAARAGRKGETRGVAVLPACGVTHLVEATLAGDVPMIVVDHPGLYDRVGGPYQDDGGTDWPDNPWRFGLLSKVAALLAGTASPYAWRPAIVHCNDWHTGLAPAYLRFDTAAAGRCGTVMTVHNLVHQGLFSPEWVSRLELPSASYAPDGLEFYGSMSFLKAGIRYADEITTVSPTYAREIQSEPLGCGLDGLLRARKGELTGILNGVDNAAWNPAADKLLARRYDAQTLEAKAANKRELQAGMQLAVEPKVPLLGVISRFVPQKGLDLVADVATELIAGPAQLVVLGAGDAELENRFRRLATDHPRRIAVRIGFDEVLAHRIEAGSDAFLMPSRFEPCGMNQMYSQRYGTPPVVRATGGLVDTVVDCTAETLAAGTATGFVFAEASADALLTAVRRATDAYLDPGVWRALQENGMAMDFSWDLAARRYADVYAAAMRASAQNA